MSEPLKVSETSTNGLQYQLLDLDEGVTSFAATGVSTVPSPMIPWPRTGSVTTRFVQVRLTYFSYEMCYYCALISYVFLLNGVVYAGTFAFFLFVVEMQFFLCV